MNSLSHEAVALVLNRLHEDAEAADKELIAKLMETVRAKGTTVEQVIKEHIAFERANYKDILHKNEPNFLAVSPTYGRFLYMVARARKAKRIIEFGSSMGISAIYLAAALRDNGGGNLIGSELVTSKVGRARNNLAAAGLADLVDIREGDALETLKEIGDEVDLLLLDGAFSLYLPVLKLLESHLNAGAVVLAENAFDSGYLDYVRNPANGYLSLVLPIGEDGRGNEFSVRVG